MVRKVTRIPGKYTFIETWPRKNFKNTGYLTLLNAINVTRNHDNHN